VAVNWPFFTVFGEPLQVTVRPTLRDRLYRWPMSCLSCLSATLVFCGQTVEWIKVRLGTEVGLGPGDTVLDLCSMGTQLPTERGTAAPLLFGPCLFNCGQTKDVAHLSNCCSCCYYYYWVTAAYYWWDKLLLSYRITYNLFRRHPFLALSVATNPLTPHATSAKYIVIMISRIINSICYQQCCQKWTALLLSIK